LHRKCLPKHITEGKEDVRVDRKMKRKAQAAAA